MKSRVGNLHWRALAIATAAMLVSIWAFGLVVDRADAQAGPDHSDLEHHHGFTAPGDVSNWPPRPTGASTNLAPANGGAISAFAAEAPPATAGDPSQARSLQQGPSLSDDLAAALGEDWLHISSTEGRAGKDSTMPAEKTYFSRDMNQTVIVLEWSSGDEVLTFAPDQLQPVITAGEEAEAAELGRAWLLGQGIAEVASLEGFGIRALDHGELYPVRMVYITYATSWFDDPTHSALVDLTNGIVIEGGAL